MDSARDVRHVIVYPFFLWTEMFLYLHARVNRVKIRNKSLPAWLIKANIKKMYDMC